MLIRYVGGPLDGRENEASDGTRIIRAIEPPHGDSLREVEYRAIEGWSPEGRRYFVHQDFRGSLVSDDDVAAAASWLARQKVTDPKFAGDEDVVPLLEANYRERIRRFIERSPDASPDGVIGFSDVAGRGQFGVEIRPGLAIGRTSSMTHDGWTNGSHTVIRDTRPGCPITEYTPP